MSCSVTSSLSSASPSLFKTTNRILPFLNFLSDLITFKRSSLEIESSSFVGRLNFKTDENGFLEGIINNDFPLEIPYRISLKANIEGFPFRISLYEKSLTLYNQHREDVYYSKLIYIYFYFFVCILRLKF